MVEALTKLGRVRLSKSFFMRDFLYSEIAAVHFILNVPDDPDLATRARCADPADYWLLCARASRTT